MKREPEFIKHRIRAPLLCGLLAGTLALGLAACGGGGGGGDSDPPPNNPPPPPPPSSNLPTLSTTVIDISDGRFQGRDEWPTGNADTGGQGDPVAGLSCLETMPETYHVHSHLSIFLNGEQLAVPGNIGIVRDRDPDCFYTIHTHDKSGKLHVEAEAPGMFTLGQLFQIWGRPLTATNVAGFEGLPISLYVTDNGTVTQNENADTWDDIELTSHREITIAIGTPITEIPNYTWNGD